MSEAGHTERTAARRAFKPYSAYKDSGVDWLGRIPAHWTVSRIGELTRLVNGHPFDSAFFTHGDGAPLVRIRDLNAVAAEVNYVGPSVETAWIQTGDVIIGMDGEFNVARWQGRRALLNQRMCCLRARAATEIGFIAYLLPFPLKAINDLAYSTTVKHLSSFEIRQIRVAEPPETEQQAIAAFLDRETAKIDALVAKNERLIQLLEETRTALITRAVTKGLDPNAAMKDSGVDWLGGIPAHWDVRMVKRLAAMRAGKAITSEEIEPVGDYPVFGGNGIRGYTDSYTHDGEFPLVGRQGALCGCVAFASGKFWASEHAVVAKPLASVDPHWLSGLLQAMRLNDYSQAAAQPGLAIETLGALQAPFPPIGEQRSIAAFVDRVTTGVRAFAAKAGDAIERLKELRTALISAAVTGKIDVREEVA